LDHQDQSGQAVIVVSEMQTNFNDQIKKIVAVEMHIRETHDGSHAVQSKYLFYPDNGYK